MPDIDSSVSFYLELDAGKFDGDLDKIYALLISDGDVFQASEVAQRAVLIGESGGGPNDVWLRRLELRAAELKTLDTTWLPDRLIGGPHSNDTHANVILGMFKSSMPDAQAGYTVRTQRSLEAQIRAGYRVIPCTPIGFGKPGVKWEKVGPVGYRRLSTTSETSGWSRSETLEQNALALFSVATEERPELVYAASGFFGPDMGLVALAVARALAKPLVYEMRGALPETWAYDGDGLKVHRQTSWLRWNQELRVASEAAAVVVIGEHLGEELTSGGVDAEKIFLAPNGVDTEQFSPESRRSGPRATVLGLNPHRPTLGYISNLGPREGHLIFVEAVEHLRMRQIDVNCVLVGDGPMREEVERKVSQRGLEDRVFVVGPVPHDEIVAYYSLLDIFVVPREDDRAARYTTPLKPYEAMAMGIPLIVSDLPALEEIIGNGERGTSFFCGSAKALADCIERVLRDAEGTNRKTAAALTWVTENRKWSDNEDRYRQAFGYALRSGSTHR